MTLSTEPLILDNLPSAPADDPITNFDLAQLNRYSDQEAATLAINNHFKDGLFSATDAMTMLHAALLKGHVQAYRYLIAFISTTNLKN
ncbi:MAG: hypothetical protein ACK4PR_07275, partial [Gammaproteobacteria bacterium]